MFVWLIQIYWHTRLKPLNLCCLPLLSFEIPQQPQNWHFRDSWLCNSSVNCPNISIRNSRLWGTQQRTITMKLQLAEMQSLQKTSTWFYNNPSEVQARLLGNPCQKAESKIFLKKKFWEVKLFCQKVSWALHGSIWFGAIISVLGWKYTFYHTRMLITLLSISQ